MLAAMLAAIMAAIMAANFNLAHVDFVGPTYVFQKKNDGYVLIIQACPMFFCFGARIRHHHRERLRKRLAYPAVSENALGPSRHTRA